MKLRYRLGPLLLVTILALGAAPGDKHLPLGARREQAEALQRDGNYAEAYDIYRDLALNPNNPPDTSGSDLDRAVSCLQTLNRRRETDALREEFASIHPDHWQPLFAVARSTFNATHYGYIVAGEFERGYHRGGGQYANSFERDRARALQLMEQAMPLARDDPNKKAVAGFYLEFARMLVGYRGDREAWRLQYLTDLSTLPDYADAHHYPYMNTPRGAPVHADGSPVFHDVPAGYEAAQTDGERWRWALQQAEALDPSRTDEVQFTFASFLYGQFGVHTMALNGYRLPSMDEDDTDESGTYALHTLTDQETIAKLAVGVRRFALPEEFNFIMLFRQIAERAKSHYGEQALGMLGQLFENRRQFDDAVSYWHQSIEEYGDGSNKHKQKRIDQILQPWGRFDPTMTHPAGEKASIGFVFRNAESVQFTAHRIDVHKLLDDVMEYITSNPKQLDWSKTDVARIGYRIVRNQEDKYVKEQVAKWDLDLEPRTNHFDKRITVTTPLTAAGAYLLTAEMPGGNLSKVVVWIDDTVLARKQFDNEVWYFAADAITGRPLPGARIEWFGFRQEATDWNRATGRRYNVKTTRLARKTDADGQVVVTAKDLDTQYRWLAVCSEGNRLAYLGFANVWYGRRYDQEYNRTKVFVVTDRPVYRPEQPVKFKFWVRHAQYDQEDVSAFAGQSFAVQIHNPQGEKVFEKSFKADRYGGFDGEYELPEEAGLGVYSIQIPHQGGGSFRVEEYKKPEFEVTVDSPQKPVMLGEKIKATIKANYYFGAPVTEAKVKYKVLRTGTTTEWYPIAPWDWLYGRGYWWFAYDYDWYPGWNEWGCVRPIWWWWPAQATPPEVIADAEVEIGPDGTVDVEIDTAVAKALHGDTDHRYEITAEVTDLSRRTIVGKGTVLVARRPFKVYAWVDRGHYRVGDTIHANFRAQTPDNRPVQGTGKLTLFRIAYPEMPEPASGERVTPTETAVETWKLDTNEEGDSHLQITAARSGQYRLSYTVTDAEEHQIEGGYVFVVRGEDFDSSSFRFNDIELVPDKKEYHPGEKVRLMINTDRPDSTVLLFVRPVNGIYREPEILHIAGKSAVHEIEVTKKDMPNFFVEAVTVANGRLHSTARDIAVPPEKRVLNVELTPDDDTLKPGEEATLNVRLTDTNGKPFQGSTVLSVYDKSVEYISGGSNVPEIKAFFWKWRRNHHPQTISSLDRYFSNLVPPDMIAMGNIGVFGHLIADEFMDQDKGTMVRSAGGGREFKAMRGMDMGATFGVQRHAMAAAEGGVLEAAAPVAMDSVSQAAPGIPGATGGEASEVEPTVRKEFADTAFWAAAIETDTNGEASVTFNMPENLTTWKAALWAMGHGTKVGQAATEIITTKNLILRLQAPRFFVEKDEVVLSANIHNYLESEKQVRAVLELDGGCLEVMESPAEQVAVPAQGETRVDWRVKVVREGEAVIRMKALTDEESDAVEMRFPVYVHGMLKTDSYCGVIRRDAQQATFTVRVPEERRPEQSRLEIRYSPTLAGAMVDALPYMVSYPYGCTEQTLNRFLPSVITQKVLQDMGLDLASIRDKRTNLNAQEIGEDRERAKQWKRFEHNPVFDEEEVRDMVRTGMRRLYSMQLSDGGWGWFSGWHERSTPHTTATVVHGLQIARANDVAILSGMLERGIAWLERYQETELQKLKNAATETRPWKDHADNLDALVFMVLCDENKENAEMREFLYRDRNHLAVYAKAMFGLALHKHGHIEQRDMLIRNIEQYLVEDDENQTAWLNLPNEGYWWYWYGSEYEAYAYYLKLLAATEPTSDKAAGLVKYLLNNRKHATYWNSTRDTALCVEAMADYLRASGEDRPDMTITIFVDGKKVKQVTITPEDLFVFDNKLVLTGDDIMSGAHEVRIERSGKGPVYFNGYLTNFTLEDFITRAGLEIKVLRDVYRLKPVEKTIKVAGARGQALDQRVEKFEREPLKTLDTLKSGDLVEVELVVESKNDYEYIVFEDMKAAGFEPVNVRSGYHADGLGAYMELRDEKVAFFVRRLARGRHSLSYRLRAEIPGRFSALPTRAYAMYAPELKANSDEIKLQIED